jgi:hypothetical protein
MAVKEISDGGPDGTRLGQSATDLVAFYGATPVDQPAAVADSASTLVSLKTKLNLVIARLEELGLIAS